MCVNKMETPGDITPEKIAEIRDMLRDLENRLKHDKLDPALKECFEKEVMDLLAKLPEGERKVAIEETLDEDPVSGVRVELKKK